jgi:D-alanyl-D-alanine endopeptidase (penicillin-binding protein 7)
MVQKIIDFLSSIGMVVLGILLIVLGSVSIKKIQIAYPHLLPVFPWEHLLIAKPVTISSEAYLPSSKPLAPIKKDPDQFEEPLTAQAGLAVDDSTGQVLWSRNSTEIRPLASITKLMSMLVLRDIPLDWTTTTMVIAEDSDGTTNQVRVGERYTLTNLWQASLVGSSNMAVRALVRATGLSENQFVMKMNEKARYLHLSTLRFVEPTGLSPENVGSAEDIARLLQVALKNDLIREALTIPRGTIEPIDKPARQVWSTNMLLTDGVLNDFSRAGSVGKTGHTLEAGYNFAVRLKNRSGQVIRVVILGADSNEARFQEARDVGGWRDTRRRDT